MIVAFLQARTDSTRLPNKVLKPILGKPMIIHQLERTARSSKIDKLILLTSDELNDDKLVNIVQEHGFNLFRGSKNNVLERFYVCAKSLKLNSDDIIVRLTGDCPLHDSKIIDELIEVYQESKVDYMANCVEPLYPDGLDAEVFSFKALEEAYKQATKTSQKEHVTPYLRESSNFISKNLEGDKIYPQWRLTVDEPSDFEVVQKIYQHFNHNKFGFKEIVIFLEQHPEIIAINSTINRNEGYLKSLKEDLKED